MNTEYPEVIVELANSHGGDIGEIETIINLVSEFNYDNKSIKFQIFSADGISLPDFSWYKVYQEITFGKNIWRGIIEGAHSKIGRVWIDIFDTFGVQVLNENISSIQGVKLQASVLENNEVKEALSKVDVSKITLMLNVSGYGLNDIQKVVLSFEDYGFKSIVLQIGYQRYPTKVQDTSLQKIETLKSITNNKICFADHADAESSFALDVPVLALAKGADMLEKHICVDRKSAKYDSYSSAEAGEFEIIFNKIKLYLQASRGLFISDAEEKYLKNSIQIPILSNKKESGELISLSDLKFKRTNQEGISYPSIVEKQRGKMVLSKSLNASETVKGEDFRLANIAVIVAGRLKSSRLKRKALLPIGGKSSIAWCLNNCSQISSAQTVILATSDLEEDQALEAVALSENVRFVTGDPDDVISRYIMACNEYNVDVIVRVTADCPFVSPEISEYLLLKHFESGADYTVANDFSVGTSCEIINSSALRQVKEYFVNAEYSEYMTWYFQNNPEFFEINTVDLPDELIRSYRLTLDYQEDLDMFEGLVQELAKDGLNATTENIFSVLDKKEHLNEINSHIGLKYKTDKDLIAELNKKTKMHR